MNNPASLRQRVLGATIGWLLLVLFSAGMLLPSIFNHYLRAEATQTLTLYLDELSARIELSAEGKPVVTGLLSDPRFRQPYSGLYWQVSSPTAVIRSRSLWDSRLQPQLNAGLSPHNLGNKQTRHTPTDSQHSEQQHQTDLAPAANTVEQWVGPENRPLITVSRTLTLPDYASPLLLQVGQDESSLRQTLTRLTHSFWCVLLALGLGVVVIIGGLINWSLRPLRRMQQELTAVRLGQQVQLNGAFPREIAPLADDLNALLFHYSELLTRARHHTGNLAHALKTPLAILGNQIALLPIDQRQPMQQVLAQLQQQIDSHLARARIAGANNILAVRCNPAIRTDRIIMAMEKIYSERNIVCINELDSDLALAVSDNDFDDMVGNLIENAFKWANSMITLSATEQAESLMVMIDDNGLGLDENQCQQVLQRGVRLDETVAGSGLGLNIVNEMALSYRGSLQLQRSPLGGLRAILVLPKARTIS
ncbi:MAG: ATP-binding protein [Plesiomonas sp.]|uniref:ATP-binding protein n=1 Tax=Plesiomonas sp. TaxID=2486279 RepID=UPI003F2C4769